jgi:hypothetical protein
LGLARPRKAADTLLFGLTENIHNGHQHKQGQSEFKKKGKKQRKHFWGGVRLVGPFGLALNIAQIGPKLKSVPNIGSIYRLAQGEAL